MNQFKVIGRVGQGAHGYVMKALNKFTNEEVALKKILVKTLDEGIPKNIMREVTTLKVLNHEYILELFEVVPQGMGLILVMEYLPSNLSEMIKKLGDKLKLPIIKMYLKMLLEGVKFMHESHIMHRDLKPANLLIAISGILKIGDFGLARIYVENQPERLYSHQVATRWYRAPELLYGSKNYTNAIDMWAIGCIAGEMINKAPLFPGETDIEQLAIVLHTLGTPTKETWPGLEDLPDYNKITFSRSPGLSWQSILPHANYECANFIKSLVAYDYNKRITAKKALHHQFFKEKPSPCPIAELPKPKDYQTFLPKEDDFEDIFSNFNHITDFEIN